MFDEQNVEARAEAGELTVIVLKSRDARPELRFPPGTQSQLIAYVASSGEHVAEAHRHLRPDGRLAASGRPDPKALLVAGILYTPWWGTSMRDR